MTAKRNDPCPCGSGKKYKKCCYNKEQDKRSRSRGNFFRGTKGFVASQKTQQMLKKAKVVKNEDKLSGLMKPTTPKTDDSESSVD